MTKSSKILVTGAAGFIGFHLSAALLNRGYSVTGLDNLNDYYDVNLKKARLRILEAQEGFEFHHLDLVDKRGIDELFKVSGFSYVVNLAAQAGVRYSLVNPYAYLESNLHGFLNILEACRQNPVDHLIYASSSSVYGANKKIPFSTLDSVDHPISLYAATKKSNELMAHTYSSLYQIPTTGLRFFTVYGPYGRPDMALFMFTKSILAGKPIDVYNHGRMKRDFTYIDDIVEAIVRLIPVAPTGSPGAELNPSISFAPYRVFNIGNNQPVELLRFIEILESKIGIKAIKKFLPMQPGDVPETYADVTDLINAVGFKPGTPLEIGLGKFVDWYFDYYSIERKT